MRQHLLIICSCLLPATIVGLFGLVQGQYFQSQANGWNAQTVGLEEPNQLISNWAPQYYNQQEDQDESEQQDPLVDSLVDRWLAYSKRQQQEFQQQRQLLDKRLDDVNIHLPANSPFGNDWQQQQPDEAQSIKGPVNDPEEFEAKLSELTNKLNHRMSNTKQRQQMLMNLVQDNATLLSENHEEPVATNQVDLVSDLVQALESRMNQMEQQQRQLQQQDQQQDGNSENENLINHTTEDESEASTSEYIDRPLALFGHQMVQGGAGEGSQLLGPDGTFENIQVIKTDSAIPSYCNPPNPCPLGYTAKDGCLENFINSASFSREYQAHQKCSCDNEHSLFNCASPQLPASSTSKFNNQLESDNNGPDDSSKQTPGKLETLARTIQNRFGDLASVQKLINDEQANEKKGAENDDSNYLVRSARKWSPELNYHKVDLDK